MELEKILPSNTGKENLYICDRNFDVLVDQVATNKTDILTLNTTVGSVAMTTTAQNVKGAINELDADIGNKAALTTTDKSNLVNAVNETKTQINSLALYHRISFVRDITLTGVQNIIMPWKAKAILFFAVVNNTKKSSVGLFVTDAGGGAILNGENQLSYRNDTASIIFLDVSAANYIQGNITVNDFSIDINWVKTGTGSSGTATIYAVAMR